LARARGAARSKKISCSAGVGRPAGGLGGGGKTVHPPPQPTPPGARRAAPRAHYSITLIAITLSILY